MADIDIKRIAPLGDRAFVVYELRMKDGRRFRNAELITVQAGKVKDNVAASPSTANNSAGL